MEDGSIFDPPVTDISQNFTDFNINELPNNYNLEDDDNLDDLKELMCLFNQQKPKNINTNEPISSSFIKLKKSSEKNIKIKNSDKLIEKLETFLFQAYKLICEDNENDLIEKEKIKDNIENNNKDELNFINIIQKLIENEKENFKMNLSIKDGEINENYFNIILFEKHEINMCNDLLNMKIKIKLEIKMALTSGNVEINFHYSKINYNKKSQKIKLKPNLKCLIINSIIGKKGATYCSCGNVQKCIQCKNRGNCPFDDLLHYLKKDNNIKEDLKLTILYFRGCNSYKNNSNYKCSFCAEFFMKKSNIVRLFCNKEIDPDHTCQFWICKDCYEKKSKYNVNKNCPNCDKFIINFKNLKSFYKWKNMQNQ